MEKQYVVLIYKKYRKEWAVIPESAAGVNHADAMVIRDYHIKYNNESIDFLRVVKIFEAAIPEE